MFRAVLDTCTLVPSLQRDFLLQLATEGAYAPVWGSGILVELDYTLARLQTGRDADDSEEQRRHLLHEMNRAFPGAEVEASKQRAYDYGLNDLDDGHVAHAAIIGKADAIVTDDKRAGFRTAVVLQEANVETVTAHEFAANTVAAHPQAGVRALTAMAERRTKPKQVPEEILDMLVDRYDMHEVADTLRPLLAASG